MPTDEAWVSALPRRKVGTTAIEVTELGFGGAPLGDFDRYVASKDASATLEAAWELGYRYFDTAPLYGHGLSEHRLGQMLRECPRPEYVLSTKVGRILRPERADLIDRGPFLGGLNFAASLDYSYDGTMRSLEQSCHRLGMDRIDIALIHDVDVRSQGNSDMYRRRFDEAMGGAYRALEELRRSGVISAMGIGVNELQPCLDFARAGRFDCFLLAGRYTLLEQDGAAELLALADVQSFSLLVGAPFNSGVLVSGTTRNAKFDYKPAPAAILDRVAKIEVVCREHSVPLAAAALQFPLGHPRVASVVPGLLSSEQVRQDVEYMALPIPSAFWRDLKSANLLSEDAPVPVERCAVPS